MFNIFVNRNLLINSSFPEEGNKIKECPKRRHKQQLWFFINRKTNTLVEKLAIRIFHTSNIGTCHFVDL